MKGIILAGGAGSRLYPLTHIITKQLQPIYDKPMIYYPLSLLMMMDIKEILIISTPHDIPHFKNLLGTGNDIGINISYAIQPEPKGIAQAYIIGENFINNDHSMMILGDNLFHGDFNNFRNAVKYQINNNQEIKAHIFAYPVTDPERYGVVEFDKKNGKVLSIEEKPGNPKSNFAIPGLYIFDGTASKRAKEITPSKRGEVEITELIKSYLKEGTLKAEVINRGMAWLDTGTPQSLLEASSYIAVLEQRQGLKVACLEEIALRKEFINVKQYQMRIDSLPNSYYKEYLINILKEFKG